MALGKTIREFGVKLSMAFDKSAFAKADSAIGSMAESLKKVGIGAAAAAGTIFGFAEATAANAFDLERSSEALGINAERLQELAYGAKVAGGATKEDLTGGLESVNKTLDDFRSGNVEAAATLQSLNIPMSVLTDRTKTADQMMAMIADRLNTINDPIRKAALGNKIFGASYEKLAPYLAKGSKGMVAYGKEARNVGAVISDKVLKQQMKFQEQMLKLTETIKGLSFMIGGQLIKQIGPLVAQFQKWLLVNRKFIVSGIVSFIKGLGTGLVVAWKAFLKITTVAKQLIGALGGIERVVKLVLIAWGLFTAGKAVLSIASMVSGIYSLGAAFISALPGIISAGAAIWTTLSPILLIGAAVGAAVLAFHELWALLSGNPTWVGQFWDWFKALDAVKGALAWISDSWGKVKDSLGGFLDKAKSFAGFGSATTAGSPGGAGGGGDTNNQFQTQVTVQIPPGTSASQAQSIVAGGVHDGLHGMLRQAKAQAAGGVAY